MTQTGTSEAPKETSKEPPKDASASVVAQHAATLKALPFSDMRDFDDWSMAFQNLDEETARQTPGYSQFMNITLPVFEFASDPSRASPLLRTFRKTYAARLVDD